MCNAEEWIVDNRLFDRGCLWEGMIYMEKKRKKKKNKREGENRGIYAPDWCPGSQGGTKWVGLD